MDKIIFLINPISGKKSGSNIVEIISSILQKNNIDFDIVFTEYKGHAYKLANENLSNYKKIVAVGGDGTVNEISRALVGTDNLLGIIPTGSGNGLARSLKIPRNYKKAIDIIVRGNILKIDSGKINDHHFISVAGVGFDAEIAHAFAKSEKRGFKTYFKQVFKDFIKYIPQDMIIEIKGHDELKTAPFLVSFANSKQWGNNVYINPVSIIDDGLFEICILNKFHFINTPVLVWRLFTRSIHKSKYLNIFHTDNAVIKMKNSCKGHVDGEPVIFYNILNISILKNSINVIV